MRRFSHLLATARVLACLSLCTGCSSSETTIYGGELPVASAFHEGLYWVATIRFEKDPVFGYSPNLYSAQASSPTKLELVRAFKSFVSAAPDVLPKGAAALVFSASATQPSIWAMPNPRVLWFVPADLPQLSLSQPLSFIPTSLQVVNTRAGGRWLLARSESEYAFALIDPHYNGWGGLTLNEVLGAGCSEALCWFAELASDRLSIKVLQNDDDISAAKTVHETFIDTKPRSEFCFDGHRHYVVVGRKLLSFSSQVTDVSEQAFPEPTALSPDYFLHCGPTLEENRYWLATSPNSVTVFAVSDNGGSKPYDLPVTPSFRTFAASPSGWVIAQAKQLNSKKGGKYCNLRECEIEREVDFGLEILEVPAK